MIIGTTSLKSILQDMEVVDCFNVTMNVPSIKLKEEVSSVLSNFNGSGETISKISQKIVDEDVLESGGIPIKNMILSIELALQKNEQGKIEFKTFMESFNSVFKDSF